MMNNNTDPRCSWIEYLGENKDFKWVTTRRATFDIMSIFKGHFTLYNGDGKAIAVCEGGVLKVMPGYKWDGCTFIGNFTETPQSLVASIAHDILYIAKKNKRDLGYTLSQADQYFRELMTSIYERDGVHHAVRPYIYRAGIFLFGWPYKFTSVPGYTVSVP